MAIGTLDKVILTTTEEIIDRLGIVMRKEFEGGSYAEITPPLVIKYSRRYNRTQMKLNYVVKSFANEILWPVKY